MEVEPNCQSGPVTIESGRNGPDLEHFTSSICP